MYPQVGGYAHAAHFITSFMIYSRRLQSTLLLRADCRIMAGHNVEAASLELSAVIICFTASTDNCVQRCFEHAPGNL